LKLIHHISVPKQYLGGKKGLKSVKNDIEIKEEKGDKRDGQGRGEEKEWR